MYKAWTKQADMVGGACLPAPRIPQLSFSCTVAALFLGRAKMITSDCLYRPVGTCQTVYTGEMIDARLSVLSLCCKNGDQIMVQHFRWHHKHAVQQRDQTIFTTHLNGT